MSRSAWLAAGALCVASLGTAQQAPPGCTSAAHRQFDFWIGDWTVTDSAGATVYGRNRITSEESGCLIHEHWTGAKGGTGQSLNFYDVAGTHWEQVWVGSGGQTLRLVGHLDGTRLLLEGEGLTPAGAPLRHRAVWSPEPDGRVRQFWQTSADGGATWQVFFDGWYRKRSG